jgi:aryl-alcohol dehydrogenase-like predicted oxidoreductase
MKYRQLGNSGIDVSVVCLGCWAISTKDFFWESQTRQDSIDAIHASLDAGVNFFDTAPAYGDGDSEEVLGDALGSRRQDIVLATKVGPDHLQPAVLRQHCQDSLRRLKTDYVDLYQVHWPNPKIPWEPTCETLESLKSEGKIRFIGVSNFGVGYLEQVVDRKSIVSNQLPYNPLWRAIEYEIAPTCRNHGIAILCYSPLCQGLLTGKFATPDEVPEKRARSRLFAGDRPLSRHGESGCEEDTFATIAEMRKIAESRQATMGALSLAWLLRQPGVVSVVTGARNAEQAMENIRAAEFVLDDMVSAEISRVTEHLKTIVGPNADMWEGRSRMEPAENRT